MQTKRNNDDAIAMFLRLSGFSQLILLDFASNLFVFVGKIVTMLMIFEKHNWLVENNGFALNAHGFIAWKSNSAMP